MAWHGMQNKGKEISQIKPNQVKTKSPEQHHGGIRQNLQDRRYMDNGLRAKETDIVACREGRPT
jgi:hypothetical protein